VAGAHAPDGVVGRRITAEQEPLLAELTGPGAEAVVVRPTPGATGPLADMLSAAGPWTCAPFGVRDTPTGVLIFAHPQGGASDSFAEIAGVLAGQGAVAYENAILFSQVERLATIDHLSGISNRRRFFEQAGSLFAAGGDAPLAAIMIDIDHFKRINDRHGHGVGDEVIRAVAQQLTHATRPGDAVGRYGGEEFGVVLRMDRTGALDLAERLRSTVTQQAVSTAAGLMPVSVSVGLAMREPADRDIETLVNRADRALYTAKRAGRDRVAYDG
jgi:diguanylate cyclase (GGDEF)-like protein